MLRTPVLLLIFNRPDLLVRTFQQVQKVQPEKLFVAADGPRLNVTADIELCEAARQIIIKNINWDCEIKTLFRPNNIGCRKAVPEALTWFFNHVDQGIILEDDCLAHTSFFSFCEQLLNKYKDENTIYHIGGNNFQLSEIGESSYYLSKLPHSWGWATWRRAWSEFDIDIHSFNENENISYFNDKEIDLFWKRQFKRIKDVSFDEWDYQWTYTLFKNEKYALLPQHNLVRNIGFDQRSFRTASRDHYLANLKTFALENIIHLNTLSYNPLADINFQKLMGWYTPIYENRISGSMALKTVAKIAKKRISKNRS